MNEQELKKKLKSSFELFLKNEKNLLEIDINERTLTSKFAQYLQKEFENYNVDCEYNRNIENIKRIKILEDKYKDIKPNDIEAKTVFPDIIIHKRGNNENNLLVIEAKKNNKNDEIDKEKLKAYKNELGYKYAYKLL